MGIKHKLDKITMLQKQYGMGYVIKRTGFRFIQKVKPTVELNYDQWKKQNRITATQAKNQKQFAAEHKNGGPYFLVMLDTTEKTEAMIARSKVSLAYQTYKPEKVFLGDIRGMGKRIEEYRATRPEDDFWILRMAAGDVLAPEFMYRCARAITDNGNIDVWYTDHEICRDGEEPEVVLKPDFSEDYLCAHDYIGNSFVVKNRLTETFEMNPYTFLLRKLALGCKFGHIAKCLYTVKQDEVDTSVRNVYSELKEEELRADFVRRFYTEDNKNGKYTLENVEVTMGDLGVRRVDLEWKENPKVSVVIPNKDHIEDLEVCLEALAKQSILEDLEIIIVENNSCVASTFAYYQWLTKGTTNYYLNPQRKNEELREKIKNNIRILYWDDKFNYSAINNFAVSKANGDYILLLNNDVELMDADTLKVMRNTAMMDRVGMVGARLYYSDDTIQHAGVVVGFKGVGGHSFTGLDRWEAGYNCMAVCPRRVMGVTAACLMMPKKLFEDIGGFDERYAVAFNDVDMCIRAFKTGAQIIYQPFVEGYHYESKTRGSDNVSSQHKRFAYEISTFVNTWHEELLKGDPYYNINKSLQTMEANYREVYFSDDWF